MNESSRRLDNINVVSRDLLPTPRQVKEELPVSEAATEAVLAARESLRNILDRKDPRLMVVVGPCSIHDLDAAREYATRLAALSKELAGSLFILMRVYFEKPRTTVGWKGLINDPDMDDSFHVEKGLRQARGLLLELAELGLPAATEALDPLSPQYLSDLMSWAAIGARTTESQTHREMASGLSTPVGFKNATDGSLDVAINALSSVSQPHHFLGISQDGQSAVFRTRGNAHSHIILRGGGGRPNYDSVSIALCERALAKENLAPNIMVDCSHGNSFKQHELQPQVAEDVAHQILHGNKSIIGLMLESNLEDGNQKIPADLSQLKRGVSVTDACIGWDDTERILRYLAKELEATLKKR
ncbi:3-deoxy-7-phosphoheptulonate synthase [bacterium]|nr:3-deoxy-7-phosphoheptulonate synthase [bacterium]